ncbi:MAG: ATP-binding protein [Akkermansia sp.]|nr:ATP-binding protein [Akkermansia sp.]
MDRKAIIERDANANILEAAGMYPVVTICGPRQSGKTTLARHLFPNYDYVNLEEPDVRLAFESDPRGFLLHHPAPCIYDEVQNAPRLLSYLQSIVDSENKPGMYILTGSRQMELQESITQSLAGRTAMVDLLPLSQYELQKAGIEMTRDEKLFYGGLPRVHAQNIKPNRAYSDYLRTYVERDVRKIINVRNVLTFEIFIRLLASRVGQIINYSSLAGDVGVSATTIKEWVSMLEASYIVFTLHPYYKNYGKRLTKSPKIYFTETGLVTSLLGIKTVEQVGRDPLIGNIYENYVISEFLKTQLNKGETPDLFFFRDSNGFEIDLILEQQRLPKPIEIKSAYTYNADMGKNLRTFAELVLNSKTPVLIYAGQPMGKLQGVEIYQDSQIAQLLNQ